MSEAKRDADVRQMFFKDLRKDYAVKGRDSFIFQYFLQNRKPSFYQELSVKYQELIPGDRVEYVGWLFTYLKNNSKYYSNTKCKPVYEELLSFLCHLQILKREETRKITDDDEEVVHNRLKTKMQGYLDAVVTGIENKDGKLIARLEKVSERRLKNLTNLLQEAAIHIVVQTYLLNSGYPVREAVTENKGLYLGKKITGEQKDTFNPRKKDFTMQLFSAYSASEEGYIITRRSDGGIGGKALEKGASIKNGFYYCCVNDEQDLDLVLKNMQARPDDCEDAYIPLVIDLISGCTLGIFGKSRYFSAYENAVGVKQKESMQAYLKSEPCCCFDYLHLSEEGDTFGSPHILKPVFHERVGNSYRRALHDFKKYCVEDEDYETPSPRHLIGEFNGYRWEALQKELEPFFQSDKDKDEDLDMADCKESFDRTRALVQEERKAEEKRNFT